MFQYQKTNRYFAQVAPGMEDLATKELESCGAKSLKPVYLGIYFEANKATLYKLNYTAKCIIRILAPLLTFQCRSTEYLYKRAFAIDWSNFFKTHQTFAVFATVSHSKITHSKYASLCLKDAIVDFFKEKFGKRPNVNTENPDVWLNLHIENNEAVINIDTSGGSLHRRGYRKKQVQAPIQETLAAAIIELSEWDGTQKLYDPMCGSGTLLFEALMKYCKIPSGFLRKNFGFFYLPNFDKKIWESVKKEENEKIQHMPKHIIWGSDISSHAIEIAKENSKYLGCGKNISFKTQDIFSIKKIENSIIVCNPPYGIRIEKNKDLSVFYKSLGDFLKQKCTGSVAYIYFGDRKYIKKIGLRTTWKKELKNGGLDGRLVKIELY